MQRVKKENDELKLKLAAVEEKAKADIETAIQKREQELYKEGNRKFQEEKAKLFAGATTTAPEASERAAAEYQRISAAAQEATENAKREQQKREQMEKEYRASDKESLLPLHNFWLQSTHLQRSPYLQHLRKRPRNTAARQRICWEEKPALHFVT